MARRARSACRRRLRRRHRTTQDNGGPAPVAPHSRWNAPPSAPAARPAAPAASSPDATASATAEKLRPARSRAISSSHADRRPASNGCA